MIQESWNKENLWRLLTSEEEANVGLARQILNGVPFVMAKEMMMKSDLYWRVKRIFYDSLTILIRHEEQGEEEFTTENYLGVENEKLKNYWIRFEDILDYRNQKINDPQIQHILRWRVFNNVRAYTKEDAAFLQQL
ncbi:hypothetical protein BKI52_20350 [marine bacterium AO1-C]|nr:hypothetical protein BKI52_20350 [marine bacterium AO1-C]